VAELGCVWGVDGFYGQYIAGQHPDVDVTMVDAIWNDKAIAKCSVFPKIRRLDGNFMDDTMPALIGPVDAVIFFDILLHMVAPNWDRVLQMYAPFTNSFLIVNPQFVGSPITVRLLDLGHDAYFENIPHAPDYPIYQKVFANPHEVDAMQHKTLKDSFYIWQWGITNADLIHVMARLGFEPILLQRDTLVYGKAKNFVNYGFVFVKTKK